MHTVTLLHMHLSDIEYAAARAADRANDPVGVALIDVGFGSNRNRQIAAVRTVLENRPGAYKPVATISVNSLSDVSYIADNGPGHHERWVDHPAVTLTETGKSIIAEQNGLGLRSLMPGDLVVENGILHAVVAAGYAEIGPAEFRPDGVLKLVA